ncbi:MAG: hypothetical protein AB7I35_08605 [Ramlibacter sp.]
MAKSTYSVLIIRKGRSSDYNEFWVKNKNTNARGEPLNPSEISFTELIEAKNLDEAIALAQAKYPQDQVSRSGSERIGKA